MNKSILLIGFKFPHHSEGAGYDELAKYVNAKYINADNLFFGGSKFGTLKRKLNLIILEVMSVVVGVRYDVIHYMYPEQSIGASPFIMKLLGKKILLTLHLDDNFWIKMRGLKGFFSRLKIKSCSDLIVLTKSDFSKFSREFPGKNIHYIPHGYSFDKKIDIEKRPEIRTNIICVGSNYRDFELLREISENIKIDINVVGADEKFKEGIFLNKKKYLSNSEYKILLQNTGIGLLPLTFATANNTLFEYINNGILPLVSDVPGVRDYYWEPEYVLRDANAFTSAINSLSKLTINEFNAVTGRIKNKYEKEFSWDCIAKKIEQIYRS